MLLPGLRLEKHAGERGEDVCLVRVHSYLRSAFPFTAAAAREGREKKTRFIELQSGEKHKPASMLNERKRATPD